MNKLTKIAATVMGVVATMGVAGLANAAPLQIVSGTNPAYAEAIGDPGGTNYANGPTAGATAGPGLPTAAGGWPSGLGFAVDTGMPPGNGKYGISGWDGSYLNLAQAGNVTFQFMGKGDATDHDIFQVWNGSSWATLWDNASDTNGTCGVTGTSPNCTFAGSQVSQFFNAGLLAFKYVNVTTGLSAINDGSNNLSPDHPVTPGAYPTAPGYFLGADPYLATGAYSCGAAAGDTCSAVYAGFTDHGFATEAVGDHDYEDLIVRISAVPEPGSMALLGLGLVAMAGLRRRRS